jgi:hypothetical protein
MMDKRLARLLTDVRVQTGRYWFSVYRTDDDPMWHADDHGGVLPRYDLSDDFDPDYEEMRDALSAPVYVVTGDMVALLDATYQSVPLYRLAPSDLLTTSGFVLFARPIVVSIGVYDAREPPPVIDESTVPDQPVPIDGLAWRTNSSGIGGCALLSRMEWNGGGLLTATGRPAPRTPDALTAPFGWHSWAFGVEFSRDNNSWSLIAAFLRLIRERVVVSSEDRLPRADARALDRVDLPLDAIVTVTLRRAAKRDDEGGGAAVDWSHRWLVRAHWRQQWYPSENRHAPILVAPYVKGPEDKPFIAKDRIFEVSR